MSPDPLRFPHPVTLVGAAALDPEVLAEARAIAPVMVAADSGADSLHRLGLEPAAVIGDLDSIADAGAWRARGVPVHHLPEQETTDFEKCLYATEAPLYLGTGFTGARLDHTLAVFHALLRYPAKTVALLGPEEAMALAPADRTLRLSLEAGARVSVFPLLELDAGPSHGLVWPLDGLRLGPGRIIGTSNRAAEAEVTLRFEGPGALVMVERRFLAALVAGILPEG